MCHFPQLNLLIIPDPLNLFHRESGCFEDGHVLHGGHGWHVRVREGGEEVPRADGRLEGLRKGQRVPRRPPKESKLSTETNSGCLLPRRVIRCV